MSLGTARGAGSIPAFGFVAFTAWESPPSLDAQGVGSIPGALLGLELLLSMGVAFLSLLVPLQQLQGWQGVSLLLQGQAGTGQTHCSSPGPCWGLGVCAAGMTPKV